MADKHPEAVPELMAYMISIIWGSQDYAGLAWVRYVAAYRHQAASNGNCTWLQINPSLFSLCFTGKAQDRPCELCLATTYAIRDCSLSANADPNLPTRLKADEAVLVAFTSHSCKWSINPQHNSHQIYAKIGMRSSPLSTDASATTLVHHVVGLIQQLITNAGKRANSHHLLLLLAMPTTNPTEPINLHIA